jgi:hypothetical protein
VLLYLRARHYAPAIGAFTARDPYEGAASRPMSVNGYSWVEGNAVNRTDPSGMWGVADTALLNAWAGCGSDFPEGDVSGRLYKRHGFVAGQNITLRDPAGGGGGAVPTSAMVAVAAAAGGGVLLGLLAAMQAAGQIVQLPGLFLAQMASAALVGDRSFGLPQTDLLEPTIQLVPGPSPRATATPAPGFSTLPPPAINYATGPRITWESDYRASRDVTGACVACATATILNPKFCNVNLEPGHGCRGCHIHVYKFHQDAACNCRIGQDDPYVICMTNPYEGPPGGPHFPLITSIPAANPELSICTGGWIQT